jgi:hypothetical protein
VAIEDVERVLQINIDDEAIEYPSEQSEDIAEADVFDEETADDFPYGSGDTSSAEMPRDPLD